MTEHDDEMRGLAQQLFRPATPEPAEPDPPAGNVVPTERGNPPRPHEPDDLETVRALFGAP